MKIEFSASHLDIVSQSGHVGIIATMSYGQVVTLLAEIKEVMSVEMWADLMEEVNGGTP